MGLYVSPVVLAALGNVVLVPFELSPVVVSWVVPLVAGIVDSNLLHTVVLAPMVPVLMCLPGPVLGSFFYLMYLGCFARSWHTSYRLWLRVSRLGRKCTKLVGYTPFCYGLPHYTSSTFISSCCPGVLVNVNKTPAAPT